MFSQFNTKDDSPTIRYNASACTRCYEGKTRCSKEPSGCIKCLKAGLHCDYKRERAPYGVVPQTTSAYQSVQSEGTEDGIISNQFTHVLESSPSDSNTEIWTDAYTTLGYGDNPLSKYNMGQLDYSSSQQLNQQQGQLVSQQLSQQQSPMTAILENTQLPHSFSPQYHNQQFSAYSEIYQSTSTWTNVGQEQYTTDSSSPTSAEDCVCVNRFERQLIGSAPNDDTVFPLLSAARDGITDLAKLSGCQCCLHLSSTESLAMLLAITQGLVHRFDTLLGHCRSLANRQETGQTPVTIYLGSIYRALLPDEHVLLYISLLGLQVQRFLSQLELLEKAVCHTGTPTQHSVIMGHMRRMQDTQQKIVFRKKCTLVDSMQQLLSARELSVSDLYRIL